MNNGYDAEKVEKAVVVHPGKLNILCSPYFIFLCPYYLLTNFNNFDTVS